MIRVVVDTNIVVSAVLQRSGFSAAVIDLVARGEFKPCISLPILEEYREVLTRSRIRADPQRAQLILALLFSVGILVTPVVTLAISPDPDDNMFLECADAARADFLVTGNTADFPARYKSTLIVTPRAFIEAWQASKTD